MRTLQTALLAFVVAAASLQADAQTVTKVGTTAAKFLSIPIGPRAIAMGSAFAGVSTDATALYWNAAGAARIYQNEAVFSHTQWIADMNVNYGAVVIPLEGLGTVGFSFTSLTMDEMERTTITQPEGTGQFFGAGSFALGVSYARNLTDWFSIGGTVKYVNEYIWNSDASGFAVDLGTLFTTPFDGVTFGAGITNFGTKMQMDGDDLLTQKDISPNNGNNPNINARLATDQFEMPLALRIGFSYHALRGEDHSVVVALDALYPNDNYETVNLGVEYTALKAVSLRAGYRELFRRSVSLTNVSSSEKATEESVTLGGGVRYGIGASLALRFDYAFASFGRLPSVHTFALGVFF